jgi:glycosyltransferase involved in cell wall biosynthesis
MISFEEFAEKNLGSFRSRIDFRGQMSHSELMSVRRDHFATIVASQYESMGYSVLEAMSVGCPVVATSVGGIPELIGDMRNGLLVPPRDVGATVKACRRLLEDHAFAARLGRQAWLDSKEHYDPVTAAKRTIAVYEEAIDIFKSQSRS